MKRNMFIVFLTLLSLIFSRVLGYYISSLRVPYSQANFTCEMLGKRLAVLDNHNREKAASAIKKSFKKNPAAVWIDNYGGLEPRNQGYKPVFNVYGPECIGLDADKDDLNHYVLCES